MCKNETEFSEEELKLPAISEGLERCKDLELDGLVEVKHNKLNATESGKAFLRNICLCFDAHYWRKVPEKQVFSTVA